MLIIADSSEKNLKGDVSVQTGLAANTEERVVQRIKQLYDNNPGTVLRIEDMVARLSRTPEQLQTPIQKLVTCGFLCEETRGKIILFKRGAQ